MPLFTPSRSGFFLLLLPSMGCVSLGEHERQLAEVRAAHQAEKKQNEALVATIATLHASLRTEREMRDAVLKQFERQLLRLNETTSAIDTRMRESGAPQSSREPATPAERAQQAELRAELTRLKSQEKTITQRIERLEGALQALNARPQAAPARARVAVDTVNPWQR